jgi:ABC-type sugar transport system substrate-binding protein
MMTIHRRAADRPGRRFGLASVLVVAVVAMLLTACSSSKHTTSPTTAPTSGTGASATTAGGSSGLQQAEAFVAKYEQRPTQITDTTKVTGTIPKGKTVYFIPCGPNPECQQEGQIVKQADDLLGWSTVILPNDGSPQNSKADFDQVVRAKAAAVLYTAIPQSTFQSEIPALQANGTVVSTCCVTDQVGNGIDYAIDVPSQVGPVGGAQAAILAADSKCTNASAVVVNIPDFAILANGVTDFKSALQNYCPGSSVSELDIALADIANANTTIVSYVRSHPSVKYVVASTDGITIGLPAAMQAAGLSGVKLIGQGATPTNIQYLHSGQELADVAFPYYEVMWSMVNAVVEKEAGMSITPSVAPPLWILTPSNAPSTSSAAFPVVPDYEAQYKALWGLS